MHLFDVIPDTLFSILSSGNKALYVNALFVLLEAFKQHLRIPKNELHAMLCSHLEEEIRRADFSGEELLETEKTSVVSGRASFLIRKLKTSGWLLIETEQDFREYVSVPSYSHRMIQMLYDIANIPDTENFAYVYSTYSSLRIADESREPMEMITALTDGKKRTDQLVESLKSAYHGITYYHQKLIGELNVNEVLYSHYEVFQHDIVSRILRPLKIKDSVPKYRGPLSIILKKWLVDEIAMEQMASYLIQSGKFADINACKEYIRETAWSMIDTYERLDKDYISIIDSKNRQYTHSTMQKIDYLINSDQSVKGNLITILKVIAADNGTKTAELAAETFDLYELGTICEESLYQRKQGVRRQRTAELVMEELPEEMKNTARRAAAHVIRNKYSKQRVNAFVKNLLSGKSSISTDEYPVTQDDDYIFTLFAAIYADAPDVAYTVAYTEDEIENGHYRLPLMTFYRKEKQ